VPLLIISNKETLPVIAIGDVEISLREFKLMYKEGISKALELWL
jgi:hypothetical protein